MKKLGTDVPYDCMSADLQLEKLHLLKDNGHYEQNGRESDTIKKQHENYHQVYDI